MTVTRRLAKKIIDELFTIIPVDETFGKDNFLVLKYDSTEKVLDKITEILKKNEKTN